MNKIELLADVFAWACERSRQQYRAIADSLPQPDPIRRMYRDVPADVIGEIVRKGWAAEPLIIEREAANLVPDKDRTRFVEMTIGELKGLHEGNIARYRLRLPEFRDSKARQRQCGTSMPMPIFLRSPASGSCVLERGNWIIEVLAEELLRRNIFGGGVTNLNVGFTTYCSR